ncbi:ribonuclease P protein component [Roseicella frigidaeris]|uniref:Ribonuclease P protein component n=1 Tax=Roseicella frigidaeris TaxID=2230885 RepID=A0A327MBJ0_9PROT|nr:ribonuclease P protein component [Roseicella frigidaeris]RAI59845.1 ribonuclease P protein component [Roseicella frigidaeris]
MPGRLPRLTRRGEFLKVAGRGRKAARPGLVLQALPQPAGGLRLGFTATKKIGNAVIRNRAKRRLREAARLLLGAAPPASWEAGGWDLVLIARDGTGGRPWPALLGDLRGALRQAGVPDAGLPAAPAAPAREPRP